MQPASDYSHCGAAAVAIWRQVVRRKTSHSRALSQDKSLLTMASTDISPSMALMSLPDDLLQRLLVGVPLDDHRAAASVCRAFRDVINGPRFLALRRRYGFAEYGIVFVKEAGHLERGLRIGMAHTPDGMVTLVRITAGDPYSGDSTTDGGTRMFVSTERDDNLNQILAVDAASRRWKYLASLPLHQNGHCLEWHGGLLYVAGGWGAGIGDGQHECLHTLQVFDERAALWDELPPMPHACTLASSGVIGDQLFVAGGYNTSEDYLTTLQIYDIGTRVWRLGASMPRPVAGFPAPGIVYDAKLFVTYFQSMLVYDPHVDTWTEERIPWVHGVAEHAYTHNGRIVVFATNGTAFQRASDGSWSPYEKTRESHWTGDASTRRSESVLLG